MKRQRKIVGNFCEKTVKPSRTFDRRSFRYRQSGKAWLIIGCPKGKWYAEGWITTPSGRRASGRCRVGTTLYKILVPVGHRKRCPSGAKRIEKG
jgi:hypothetical protein